MTNRSDGEVDIEVGPIQVVRLRPLDASAIRFIPRNPVITVAIVPNVVETVRRTIASGAGA